MPAEGSGVSGEPSQQFSLSAGGSREPFQHSITSVGGSGEPVQLTATLPLAQLHNRLWLSRCCLQLHHRFNLVRMPCCHLQQPRSYWVNRLQLLRPCQRSPHLLVLHLVPLEGQKSCSSHLRLPLCHQLHHLQLPLVQPVMASIKASGPATSQPEVGASPGFAFPHSPHPARPARPHLAPSFNKAT